MGFAELIESEAGGDPARVRSFAGKILAASRHAADFTAKLLSFARKGKYPMRPVNLHDTVREVVELLEHTIDKRIAIVQRLGAPAATVLGDPTQLENAVLNLAMNGRDAMPSGGTSDF